MNRKVKRWKATERPGPGNIVEVVDYSDYAALETECNALWSTYVALVDKLGIDTEKAKTADGKPSDVIVSYVDALRAELAELRAILTSHGLG